MIILLLKKSKIKIGNILLNEFANQKKLVVQLKNLKTFYSTQLNLFSVNLFKKIAGTDAKALVSIHALAALNIHFGGNKYISQSALSEHLKNLTYQILSQENIYVI